jgi:hypothetical protein
MSGLLREDVDIFAASLGTERVDAWSVPGTRKVEEGRVYIAVEDPWDLCHWTVRNGCLTLGEPCIQRRQ